MKAIGSRSVAARIRALERTANVSTGVPRVSVHWDNELVACGRDANCWIDQVTGEHLGKVIRLSWREPGA